MQNKIRASKPTPVFQFHTVHSERLADTETPVSMYLKLQDVYSCLLESVEGEDRLARFSYIGIEPFAVFRAWNDGRIDLDVRDKKFDALSSIPSPEQSPVQTLSLLLDAFSNARPARSNEMLTSGAFGFIGYDAACFVERVPKARKPDAANLPDMFLMFYDTLVVFDNVTRKLHVVSNFIRPNDKPNAEARVEKLLERLSKPLPAKASALRHETVEMVKANMTRDEYLACVDKAKTYILAGDIFQVQVSQRLSRPLHAKAFDVYRSLRTVNPSPYLYFFDLGEASIVGSSPELLVSVESTDEGKRIVNTRPIAGTKPRGATPNEDAALAHDLLSDEKELAEHLMLIDLSRNDIGRIAKIGTVETNEMMTIEKYSHVMHIVSNVRGELRDDLSAMDAFWSCFPAGTLTGAPKIRAMEIIYELESEKRGLYGGAVGFIDFNGALKMAIAIRTMVVSSQPPNDVIYFQAAAGVVADSVPEKEYQETMNKMRAGLRAVEQLTSLKSS